MSAEFLITYTSGRQSIQRAENIEQARAIAAATASTGLERGVQSVELWDGKAAGSPS